MGLSREGKTTVTPAIATISKNFEPLTLHILSHVQGPAWLAVCTWDEAQLLHFFLLLHYLSIQLVSGGC